MSVQGGILTATVSMYGKIFSGYIPKFLHWGESFFYVGLGITIIWLCLWNAFDKNSFEESMPEFIKEFFIITLFYTIMVNAGPWLGTIIQSATSIGTSLTQHAKVDPSSIIDQGFSIGGKILNILNKTNVLLNIGMSLILCLDYVVIIFCFLSIALDLAVSLLLNYILIGMSGFLLAFSVFPFTRDIARRALDLIVANSIRVMTIYVVVSSASGTGIFNEISKQLSPKASALESVEAYGWIVVATLLFWMMGKNIPMQISRLFSDVIQANKGTSAAALAMAAVKTASAAYNGASAVSGVIKGGNTSGGGSGTSGSVGNTMGDKKGSNHGGAGSDNSSNGKLNEKFKDVSGKQSGNNGFDSKGAGYKAAGSDNTISSGKGHESGKMKRKLNKKFKK